MIKRINFKSLNSLLIDANKVAIICFTKELTAKGFVYKHEPIQAVCWFKNYKQARKFVKDMRSKFSKLPDKTSLFGAQEEKDFRKVKIIKFGKYVKNIKRSDGKSIIKYNRLTHMIEKFDNLPKIFHFPSDKNSSFVKFSDISQGY